MCIMMPYLAYGCVKLRVILLASIVSKEVCLKIRRWDEVKITNIRKSTKLESMERKNKQLKWQTIRSNKISEQKT